MRPKKVRGKGRWSDIEAYRRKRGLTQYQMAHLLMVPRGVYGNEVNRHIYVPENLWEVFQQVKALPVVEENTYQLLVYDGKTFRPLDEKFYIPLCDKCGNKFVTTNPSKKTCSECKKK